MLKEFFLLFIGRSAISNEVSDMRDQLAKVRRENADAHAQIESKIDKLLDDISEAQSGR